MRRYSTTGLCAAVVFSMICSAAAAVEGPATVVEVEVLESWPAAVSLDGPSGEALPATEAAVVVTAVLRGELAVGDELVVRRPGGTAADGERVKVLGVPELEPGALALLGLERSGDGTWSAVRGLPSMPSVAGAEEPTTGRPSAVIGSCGQPDAGWRRIGLFLNSPWSTTTVLSASTS